jgi:hypothetical protein
MKKSEQINELAKALCKFHADLKPIAKDSTNPFFKSKYASLSTILKAIKEPLAKNKLSFVQLPVDNYGLTTIIVHESGQWIESTYFMNPTKDTPQEAGSVITYQRRYALGAALGLDIDEDDDANAVSQPPKKSSAAPKSKTKTSTSQKKVSLVQAIEKLESCLDLDMLKAVWSEIGKDNQTNEVVAKKKDDMKQKLSDNG